MVWGSKFSYDCCPAIREGAGLTTLPVSFHCFPFDQANNEMIASLVQFLQLPCCRRKFGGSWLSHSAAWRAAAGHWASQGLPDTGGVDRMLWCQSGRVATQYVLTNRDLLQVQLPKLTSRNSFSVVMPARRAQSNFNIKYRSDIRLDPKSDRNTPIKRSPFYSSTSDL